MTEDKAAPRNPVRINPHSLEDNVGVRIVRLAEVFARLSHPYTRGLFAARPRLGVSTGQRLPTIPGRVPELVDLPKGCPFADRCDYVIEACRSAPPPAFPIGPQHDARCIRLDAVTEMQA